MISSIKVLSNFGLVVLQFLFQILLVLLHGCQSILHVIQCWGFFVSHTLYQRTLLLSSVHWGRIIGWRGVLKLMLLYLRMYFISIIDNSSVRTLRWLMLSHIMVSRIVVNGSVRCNSLEFSTLIVSPSVIRWLWVLICDTLPYWRLYHVGDSLRGLSLLFVFWVL